MSLQLEFFTDEQMIREICRGYWALDSNGRFATKVGDLALPEGLSSRDAAGFVGQYCRVFDPDVACPICRTPYEFASRLDYQRRRNLRGRSSCKGCRRLAPEQKHAQRLSAKDAKRDRIRQMYEIERNPICPENISFRDAVSLVALSRLAVSEDFEIISAVVEADGLLSPTTDMSASLLRSLFHSGCITVHPKSPITAFEDDVKTFYLFHVRWFPPVGLEGDPRSAIASIESMLRQDHWSDEWHDESVSFWKELALHECLQYFNMCMGEHGFDFSPGEKTKQVFCTVLERHSPAQVYSFIWSAVKDAAAYMVRSGVPRKQAANSVIGRIQRSAERALAEAWNVKQFARDRRSPESTVSHVMYRVALKLEDDAINYVPGHILGGDSDSVILV